MRSAENEFRGGDPIGRKVAAVKGSKWVRRRAVRLALAAVFALVASLDSASAHDIPNEIILNGFVKPEADRLHFVVRIPLIMLTSLNLPKRGPGYLALDRIDEALERSIQATAREIVFYEEGARLRHLAAKARVSQPSNRAFASYEEAVALIAGPELPDTANVFWNQGYFDVHYEYPIRSERSNFALDFQVAPGLSGRLKLVLRYLPPGSSPLAYTVHGGFGRLVIDPRWHQAAWTFVRLGFDHLLDGIDHLLFLLCLVIPFALRQFWRLVAVVTAFTVAHSITLIASAFGVVPAGEWFPPLVENLIALSILYMAIENIVVVLRNRGNAAILRWRWLITGGFGLVHGFGFSFALQQDLQFAGAHFLLSLLSFNVGVEIAQILVLAIVLPVVSLAFRNAVARRFGIVIVSVVLAHTAWHWMVERAKALQYVDWPAIDGDFVMTLALWVLASTLLGAAIWLKVRYAERRRSNVRRESAE